MAYVFRQDIGGDGVGWATGSGIITEKKHILGGGAGAFWLTRVIFEIGNTLNFPAQTFHQ